MEIILLHFAPRIQLAYPMTSQNWNVSQSCRSCLSKRQWSGKLNWLNKVYSPRFQELYLRICFLPHVLLHKEPTRNSDSSDQLHSFQDFSIQYSNWICDRNVTILQNGKSLSSHPCTTTAHYKLYINSHLFTCVQRTSYSYSQPLWWIMYNSYVVPILINTSLGAATWW